MIDVVAGTHCVEQHPKVGGALNQHPLAEFPDAVGAWMTYATSFVSRLSRSQFCLEVLQKVQYPSARYMA